MSPQCCEASHALEVARATVLAWLNHEHRNPMFLTAPREEDATELDAQIVDRFLSWVNPLGFDFTIYQYADQGNACFVVHWTHHGSEFVGFSQPPPGATPEAAKLLGCAALLQNDWCRKRLP